MQQQVNLGSDDHFGNQPDTDTARLRCRYCDGVNLWHPASDGVASVSDLVGLSIYAMISMVLGLGKISWQPLFQQAWPPSLIGAVSMFLLISCMIYFMARPGRSGIRMKSFWRRVAPPSRQDSTRQLIVKNAIGSSLFGGVILITPFMMVGALMTAVVLIATVPMLGMQLGENHFREYVIGPTNWAPVRTGDTLLKNWSAPRKKTDPAQSESACVELVKDGEKVGSGRVVVATSNAIILFDPASGITRRVPIGELTVVPTDFGPVAKKP
jgi:hypothetical protein